MTWRRFCVLLGGLSLDSRVANQIKAEREGTKTIEDPERAEQAVARVWDTTF